MLGTEAPPTCDPCASLATLGAQPETKASPDLALTNQLLVQLSTAEYAYVVARSHTHGMSVGAVIRQAIRVQQLLESTPGAMHALVHHVHAGLPPKHSPDHASPR